MNVVVDLTAHGGERAATACRMADLAGPCCEERVSAPQIAVPLAHLIPARPGMEPQRCA